MEFNLISKPLKIVVCGYNQSGKTTLVKKLINDSNVQTLIYDWHGEYKTCGNNCVIYKPKFRIDETQKQVELNKVLNAIFVNKAKAFKILVIDEANQYCPNMKPLPQSVQDLYDNHAHYFQSLIVITRRPTDLNTSLIEVAHLRIFFRLDGKNDIQYLNNLKSGLGDVVSSLEPYHFAVLDNFGNISICKPMPIL